MMIQRVEALWDEWEKSTPALLNDDPTYPAYPAGTGLGLVTLIGA